jgi:hypothetical protein
VLWFLSDERDTFHGKLVLIVWRRGSLPLELIEQTRAAGRIDTQLPNATGSTQSRAACGNARNHVCAANHHSGRDPPSGLR